MGTVISAVGLVVVWRGVKIPTVDVIDIAVTIIVDAVAGGFSRILPDVVSQVWMGIIDARIDNSYYGVIRIASLIIPAGSSTDFGQPPLVSVISVVRHHLLPIDVVGLSQFD